MINIKIWAKYILLAALVNIVFALLYFMFFQFDGNSSCHPYLACFVAGQLFKYSGLVILVTVLVSGFTFHKENIDKAVFLLSLFFIGVFTLSAIFNKSTIVQRIESSSTFCSFAPDTTKQDSCLYRRADKDKNISECDLAGSYMYECRAKISFDKCNSLTEPNRTACFNNAPK